MLKLTQLKQIISLIKIMAASSDALTSRLVIPPLPPVCVLSKNYQTYISSKSHNKLSDTELVAKISKEVQFRFQALIQLIHAGETHAFLRSDDGWQVLSALRMLNPTEHMPFLLELITLVFEKQLLNAQPRASYEYLRTHIQDPTFLNDVARPYFLPLSDPHDILWFAIISKDQKLAETAIHLGADVNALVHVGMSPLLLACKQGDHLLAKLLIAHGANPRFIGGTHDHETPVSELRYHSEAWAHQLFTVEDIAFTNEFEERKKIAHLSSALGGVIPSTSGLNHKEFYLEGARPRMFIKQLLDKIKWIQHADQHLKAGSGTFYESMCSQLTPTMKSLLDNKSELRASLGQALLSIIPTFTHYLNLEISKKYQKIDEAMSDALERLDRNEPVICFGTTNSDGTWFRGAPNLHAWGLVISQDSKPNDYLIQLVDRSGVHFKGDFRKRGIFSLVTDKDNAITMISDYFQAWNWQSFPEPSKHISKKIHAQFATQDPHFPLVPQTDGVCCFTSFEGVVIAYLRTQFASLFDPPLSDLLAKGCSDALFTSIFEEELLDYCEKHWGASSTSIIKHSSNLIAHINTYLKSKIPEHYREKMSDMDFIALHF